MKFLIGSLLMLIFMVSESQASCKMVEEGKIEGSFKVTSVKDLKLNCVLKYEIMTATETADLKIPGCVVELRSEKKPYPRISVMMSGDGCKQKKGDSLRGVFSTNRNICCAVSARYRGVGPKCIREEKSSEISLTQDLNDIEKMCSANIEWMFVDKADNGK